MKFRIYIYLKVDLNCSWRKICCSNVSHSAFLFLFAAKTLLETFVENYSPGNRILIEKKLKILRDIARPLFLGINDDCIVHKLVYKA